MTERKKGWTADGVAISRAAHYLHDKPVIFADSCAIQLLHPRNRLLCRSGWLYRRFLRGHQEAIRPMWMGSICGFRYVDECVEQAVEAGMRQYVIIGAGLDSFALRRTDLADRLRVYELDHPDTQALKRERVRKGFGTPPEHLEFVPVDFELQTAAEALESCSFDASQPAIFSWLGTIPYLTEEAVFDTLRSLAKSIAPGSEIIFNYSASDPYVDERDKPIRDGIARSIAARGEPWRSAFDPESFLPRVLALGYEAVEHMSSTELGQRYLAGTPWYAISGGFTARLRTLPQS